MKLIITGSAGFIGYSLSKRLLDRGENIIGVDNHNNYYEPKLKESRFNKLNEYKNYSHYRVDLTDQKALEQIFKKHEPEIVVNLAAQAGVRYSIENPSSYIKSNILGFSNILENCRHYNIKSLIYANSSSVYGANTKMPFSENDSVNHPLSIYAASKKSNELMAHSYSYLFGLPTTGLRFFTVYGPWGRPDMALFKFTKLILQEKPIQVFNHGQHTRDFTYIDDIIDGIIKTIDNPAKENLNWNSNFPDPATSKAPWSIYNIGNNKPIQLLDYIKALEITLNKKAKINFLPLQPGDVLNTSADMKKFMKELDYQASININEGVEKFVRWYLDYYK